jgi:cobalamin synthase
MKEGRNIISEMLIPIVFALGIVIYLSLSLGIKHGLKAAFVTATVFSLIGGGLCLVSFLLYRKRLKAEREKEAGEITKKIKSKRLLAVSLILISIGVIVALAADLKISLVAVAFFALFIYYPRLRRKRKRKILIEYFPAGRGQEQEYLS